MNKKPFAVLLALVCALLLIVSASAYTEPTVGYVVGGAPTTDGSGYNLTLQIKGGIAYGGYFALLFDTDKLELNGADNLSTVRMRNGATASDELGQEATISSSGGYVYLAWYASGVRAEDSAVTIATIPFLFKDGYTEEDVDSTTFRIRALDQGEMGTFRGSATIQIAGRLALAEYAYLRPGAPCGVTFDYDGSDREPAEGSEVEFRFRNNLSQYLPATLELGGRVYTADSTGPLTLKLADSEYQYRISCDGYGDQIGRLTVSGDGTQEFRFKNDRTLVQEAVDELEISYAEGDSAERVTTSLGLPTITDEGVTITWASDTPNNVTSQGLVFRPNDEAVDVTLTATLTHGDVSQEKTFLLHVLSNAELEPEPETPGTPSDPSNPSNPSDPTNPSDPSNPNNPNNPSNPSNPNNPSDPSNPNSPSDPSNPVDPENPNEPVNPVSRFTDIDDYVWAYDAIEELGAAGIVGGTSLTTFTPGADIRRGDFVLMLMRMVDSDAELGENFRDVPENSYYYEAITKARTIGIVQGYEDNLFHPAAPISRQDMVTMTVRAIELTDYITLTDERDDLTRFSDYLTVGDYAVDSVSTMVAGGYIAGDQGKLNPEAYTTRAEAAVFVARIYRAHGF